MGHDRGTPAERPEERPEVRPEVRPAERHTARPAARHTERPTERHTARPTARPAPAWQRWVWRAWTPLVWAVPLLLLWLRYLTPGASWETIALFLYFPIWYPLLAGSGWAPRIVWRARAGKAVAPPRVLVTCLLLHWGGLLLAVLAGRGVGDPDPFDSVLGRLLPFLGPVAQDASLYVALAFAAAGLVGALVVAASARMNEGAEVGG